MQLHLLVALVALFAFGVDSQICNIPGASPVPLWPTQFGGPGNGSCAPGFYCPNLVPTNMTTWISVCPADANCTVTRLLGFACEPQGRFEPTLCPRGFYCPTYNQKIQCPEGNYCPAGSTQPRPCNGISVCELGAFREMFLPGIVGLIVIDVLVLGTWVAWKLWNRRAHRKYVDNVKLLDKANLVQRANKDLCDGFARSRGSMQPFEFDFSDLSLELSKKKKTILEDVTGTITPGTVTAVMGPSGAGKTTFLNTLMGKVDSSWKRGGTLHINGQEAKMSDFKKLIGYVPQEDVMHRELSVWENILFSAQVRLPSTWSRSERLRHAEAVLHALQLAEVKHTRIGDETDRGVSGGQRKRVNIGMELAAAPLALFLDEPTSGLDSTNAKDVCGTLQNIAKETGITVVMVIHQPRQEIWYSLSNVLLLAPGGRTVYQGSQALCEKYFKEHLNVKFHPLDNPADVIMDAIAARGSEFAMTWRSTGASYYWEMQSQKQSQQIREISEDGTRLPPMRPRKPTFLRANPSQKGLEVMRQELQQQASTSSSSVVQETIVIGNQNDGEDGGTHTGQDAALITADSKTRGAPFWMQIILTFLRSIRQQAIGFLSLVFENVLAGAAGFIIGLAADGVYSGRWLPPYTLVSPAPNDTLIAERGMYIHVTMGLAAASAGVRTFGEERIQFWREAASGHNRLSYFLGVSLAALPRIFLASLHFTAIFSVMSLPYMPFHEMLGIIFLVWFTIYGVSCLISMLVAKEDAPLIAVVVTLAAGVLCGYANSIPNALQYISYARWSSEAMYYKETLPFVDVMDVKFSASIWNYSLERFGLDYFIVFLYGMFFRGVAFVFMIFRNRDKQI